MVVDEDFRAFRSGQRLQAGIRTAVLAWCQNPIAAKQLYGPIASWNTSEASAPPLDVVNSFLTSAPSRTRR